MNVKCDQAAQTQPATVAWRVRRFFIVCVGAIYDVLRMLFARFCYRHLMRLTHYFGWHYAPIRGPVMPDGEYYRWCTWCGLRGNVFDESKGPLKRSDGDTQRDE